MKNSVTEDEIVSTINSHSGAMSIDAIAADLGVLRHILNPVLGNMLNRGVLTKEADKEKGTPVFSVSGVGYTPRKAAKPEVKITTATPTITHIDDARRSAPAKLTTEKPETATQAKPALVAEKAERKETQVTLFDILGETKANQGENATVTTELKILAYVAQMARPRNQIHAKFGDCEALLTELQSQQLIDSTYIIDQSVYMIREEAIQKYPELKDESRLDAILAEESPVGVAQIKESVVPTTSAPVVNQTTDTAPAAIPNETLPQIAEPAMAKPSLAEPVSSITMAPPSLAEEVGASKAVEMEVILEPVVEHDEFDQRPDELISMEESQLMAEISRMVNKLVEKRMSELQEQKPHEATLRALAQKLQEASGSLKTAAKAIDEGIELINTL